MRLPRLIKELEDFRLRNNRGMGNGWLGGVKRDFQMLIRYRNTVSLNPESCEFDEKIARWLKIKNLKIKGLEFFASLSSKRI